MLGRARCLPFLVVPLAAAASCRAPTQITLRISADPQTCATLSGLAVAVGPDPTSTEDKIASGFYATVTEMKCDDPDGDIGTLVLTPADDQTRGALVVVAGVEGIRPDSCTPDDSYANCIVARRSFAFSAHTSLDLPIVLGFDCLNVPCNAQSTCKNSTCVESIASCTNEVCGGFGTGADGGDIVVPDAPTKNDASAPIFDSGLDAASDAGPCKGPSGSSSGSSSGTGSCSGSGTGTGSGTATQSGTSATNTAAGIAPPASPRNDLRGWGFGSGSGYGAP